LKAEIAFEDVSFEYNESVPVLKHVSFRAPAGSTTALVGFQRFGKKHTDKFGNGLQPSSGRPLLLSTGGTWHRCA